MIHKLADVWASRWSCSLGKKPAGLTRAEAELLEGWRLLDPEGRRLVMELVRWGHRGAYKSRSRARSTSRPDVPIAVP